MILRKRAESPFCYDRPESRNSIDRSPEVLNRFEQLPITICDEALPCIDEIGCPDYQDARSGSTNAFPEASLAILEAQVKSATLSRSTSSG